MDRERDDLVERVEDERVSPGCDGGSERSEGEAVAGFEEVGVAGEDPELFEGNVVSFGGHVGREERAHVDEAEEVDGVTAVEASQRWEARCHGVRTGQRESSGRRAACTSRSG